MSLSDGMTSTPHRTTFSLDQEAVRRLQLLARRWNVSQAEVILRSLALAESQPYESTALQALEAFHEKGGLAAEKAAAYLTEALSVVEGLLRGGVLPLDRVAALEGLISREG